MLDAARPLLAISIGLVLAGCGPASPGAQGADAASAPRVASAASSSRTAVEPGNPTRLPSFNTGWHYEGFNREPTGGFVMLGASNTVSQNFETFRFDGTEWFELHPSQSPPDRPFAAVAYDQGRRVDVLFGGGAPGHPLLNDTWTWDGVSWTEQHPQHTPPVFYHPRLVADPGHGRLLLVGASFDYSNPSAGPKLVREELWAWTGGDWLDLHSDDVPTARYDSAVAYDDARGELIVAGGRTPTSSGANETWSWNGQHWELRSSGATPSTGGEPVHAAYEPASSRVIAFVPPAQSFAWDGKNWSPLTQNPSPSGYAADLTTDARGRVVGSFTGGSGDVHIWTHDAIGWSVVSPANLSQWRMYVTPEGYRVEYPPFWYLIPAGPADDPHKLLENMDVGAPLGLTDTGVWVTFGTLAQSCRAPTAGTAAAMTLDGVDATLYTVPPGGPNGSSGLSVQAARGDGCFVLGLWTFRVSTRDANSRIFNEIVARFRWR